MRRMQLETSTLVLIIFLGASLSAVIAAVKQRNTLGWLVFGAMLPLIAVVAVCCLPARGGSNAHTPRL